MTIIKTDPLPYEILFRFDEKTGALKGAHFCSIVSVVEDGVTIATTIGEAQPVSLGADGVGLKLADVLGTLATGQQAKLDEMTTAIVDKNTALAAKDAELAAKDANAQVLLDQIAALTTERDRLRVVVEAFRDEVNPTESAQVELTT